MLTMNRPRLGLHGGDRADADATERGRLGACAAGVSRMPAAPRRQGARRPQVLHYFTVHNITWRALPAEFGPWNSIWKRFWRLSRSGVFEAMFDALAALSGSAHLVQMFDSTIVRAHVSAAGAKGGRMVRRSGVHAAASRPKIHLKTDFDGHPIAFDLTGGAKADAPYFETLLDLGPDIDPRAALGDKGYDSKPIAPPAASGASLLPSLTNPIPGTSRAALYKGRARIERSVGTLKRFKRIALRCEKTKTNFPSFVALAAAFILLKSVHTT